MCCNWIYFIVCLLEVLYGKDASTDIEWISGVCYLDFALNYRDLVLLQCVGMLMWGVSRQQDLHGSSQRAKALGRDVWLCGVAEGLHTWRFTEEHKTIQEIYLTEMHRPPLTIAVRTLLLPLLKGWTLWIQWVPLQRGIFYSYTLNIYVETFNVSLNFAFDWHNILMIVMKIPYPTPNTLYNMWSYFCVLQ